VNDRIVVFPQNGGRQDWVANLVSNPKVKIYSDYGVFSGHAHIREVRGLDDPCLGIFARKYGLAEVKKRYWGQLEYVEIEVESKKDAADFYELVYGDLEAAFDSVADHYDEHIFGNPMNSWLRSVSVGLMKQLFKPDDVVLEIGCGTGTETVSLAMQGTTVIATDISRKMLERLRCKAERLGLSGRIVTIHARAEKVVDKLREAGYTRLDGAYSNYGAVNTEPKLIQVMQGLHETIKPGGTLLLGVWNKYCLYEIVGYTLRLRFNMTFARIRNPVPVGKSRFCVSSYSYSAGQLRELLKPLFRLEKIYGVEVLLPPSNLTRYLPRGRLLTLLKKFDLATGRAFPWNRLGDHFLAVYKNVR
jgi:SAM-dependent methyltransferase